MKKHKIVSLSLLVLALSIFATANAQANDGSVPGELKRELAAPKMEALKEKIEAKRIEAREDKRAALPKAIEAKRSDDGVKLDNATKTERLEERKANMDEKLAERKIKRINLIKAYLERMVTRFEAAADRIAKLADRTSARVTEMRSKELISEETKKSADDKLASAKNKIASIKANLRTVVTTEADKVLQSEENKKEAFEAVKDILNKSKEELKEAHASVVDVIKMLKSEKSEKPDTDDSATTTEDSE